MDRLRSSLVAATFITLTLASLPMTAKSATLIPPEQAAQIVSVRNVTDRDGEISGELVNNSRQTLRDIQLQILYSWRWKDEFHPGTNDPGRAIYITVDKDIPPGQNARFNYKPSPPLQARNDGYFDVSVKVVGFSQVMAT
jgi:hypothetical protein